MTKPTPQGVASYQGILLMPGSHARKLHDEGKWQDLVKHMKELDLKERRLRGEA